MWGAVSLVRTRLAKHEVLTYASAVAFQVVKSLIPLVLLGLALLGAVGRRDIWTDHIAPTLKPRFDEPVYHAIDFAVNKIFDSNSAGLIALSALLTIWYVSSGVRGVMVALNRIYETEEVRPSWFRWAVSLGLAVCVVAGIVGAILLVLAVPKASGAWEIPTWLVTSIGFRWYVSSIANFKTAVGQLTVLIILLVYVYVSSIVFLVGVEVDELLREDARSDERGVLDVLFGLGR